MISCSVLAYLLPFLTFFCFSLFRQWNNVKLSKREHMTNCSETFMTFRCTENLTSLISLRNIGIWSVYMQLSRMILLKRIVLQKINIISRVQHYASNVRTISNEFDGRGLLKEIFPNQSRYFLDISGEMEPLITFVFCSFSVLKWIDYSKRSHSMSMPASTQRPTVCTSAIYSF